MCANNTNCNECFDTSFITLPTGATGATGPQGPQGNNGTNGTNGVNGTNNTDLVYFKPTSELVEASSPGFLTMALPVSLPSLVNAGDSFKIQASYTIGTPPGSGGYGFTFRMDTTSTGSYLHPFVSPINYSNAFIKADNTTYNVTFDIDVYNTSTDPYVVIKSYISNVSGFTLGYVQNMTIGSLNLEDSNLQLTIGCYFSAASSFYVENLTIYKINA